VHIEILDDESSFVEVQLLTETRDAVGAIDHSMVHSGKISAISSDHADWLGDFSKCANIPDAATAEQLPLAGVYCEERLPRAGARGKRFIVNHLAGMRSGDLCITLYF